MAGRIVPVGEPVTAGTSRSLAFGVIPHPVADLGWEVAITYGYAEADITATLGVPMTFDRAVNLAAHMRAQLAHDFRRAEYARVAR